MAKVKAVSVAYSSDAMYIVDDKGRLWESARVTNNEWEQKDLPQEPAEEPGIEDALDEIGGQ